jgi:hypothetical protein
LSKSTSNLTFPAPPGAKPIVNPASESPVNKTQPAITAQPGVPNFGTPVQPGYQPPPLPGTQPPVQPAPAPEEPAPAVTPTVSAEPTNSLPSAGAGMVLASVVALGTLGIGALIGAFFSRPALGASVGALIGISYCFYQGSDALDGEMGR